MTAATVHDTKAAALAAYDARADVVIIQHRGKFRAYVDAAGLDADAAALAGRGRTIEMLERDVPRRAFADVDFSHDGPRRPVAAAAAFAAEFAVAPETVTVLPTDNGVHLLADRIVTATEHKNGLLNLAANHPDIGFDVAATHSLRLAGTVSMKGSNKPLPEGMLLSATICQPWGLRALRAAEEEPARFNEPAADGDLARRVSLAIGGSADVFVEQAGPRRGASYQFNRTRRAPCAVCEREHDSAGVYAYLFGDGRGQVFCCRAPNARGVVFFTNDAEPMTDEQRRRATGAFPAVTADLEYCEAPRHDGGAGCRAPAGDYIDGTHCGMGKSEAAWASIPASSSVVVVSYRRAFTAKTAADHKLESYANIRGPIKLWRGRRVIVQADSLARLVDAPDVLIVDEFHGIRRQLFGSLAGERHRAACNALARLMKEAGRVIVLDADANDADADAIEEARGVRPKFVRNTYKPNHAKQLTQYSGGHAEMRADMARWVAAWSAKSIAARAVDKLVVFCHIPSLVEEIAKQLLESGMRVKYYHGKTCQVQRAADFAAAEATFAAVDAVVYNSSVEAGISIQDSAYRTMFVYSNRLGSCEVLKQAIHRFRCVDRFYYASRAAFNNSMAPTTEAGIFKWLEAKRASVNAHTDDDINLETAPDFAEARHTFRSRMWIACHLDSARSARHYDARLMKMLAETGMTITPHVAQALAAPIPAAILEPVAIPAALAESPEARVARVRAAADGPNGEEYVDGKPRTADELASEQKKYIKNCYGVDEAVIDAAFVEKFGSAETMAQRKRFERAMRMYSTHQGTEDFVSETERNIMVNDVLALAGLGSLSQLDRVRIPAADLAARAATPEAAELFVKVKQQWSRVFGGVAHNKPTGEVVAGGISTRTLVGAVRCVLNCYAMSLENTNAKNPNRGLYYISEFDWPVPMTVRNGSSDPDDLVEQTRQEWALSLRGFRGDPTAAQRTAAPRTPNEARALRTEQ